MNVFFSSFSFNLFKLDNVSLTNSLNEKSGFISIIGSFFFKPIVSATSFNSVIELVIAFCAFFFTFV